MILLGLMFTCRSRAGGGTGEAAAAVLQGRHVGGGGPEGPACGARVRRPGPEFDGRFPSSSGALTGSSDPQGHRTAALAGATYPLEIHLVVGERAVADLPAGLYRYLVKEHALGAGAKEICARRWPGLHYTKLG